jgi:tRNA 2-thiouridine synthesizing protein A
VDTTQSDDEAIRSALLLRDLLSLRQSRCCSCRQVLCGHETLLSIIAGFKDAPRCFACIGVELKQSRQALREHLLGTILRRKCHHVGWVWANREEGLSASAIPPCLGAEEASTPVALNSEARRMSDRTESSADVTWDAGDMGCGELVLELRNRLKSMTPGQVLELRATDPGAPEDLPAWCRLTGHDLVSIEHPIYRIKRKES